MTCENREEYWERIFPEKLKTHLLRYGIGTADDYLGLPAEHVAERFGKEAYRHYCSLRLGEYGVLGEEDGSETKFFEESVSLDYGLSSLNQLEFVLNGIFKVFALRLDERGYLAHRIEVSLDYEFSGSCQLSFELSCPSLDVKSWLECLLSKTQGGAFESSVWDVHVKVFFCERRPWQKDFFLGASISPESVAKVLSYLEQECEQGAGSPKVLDSYCDDAYEVQGFRGQGAAKKARSALLLREGLHRLRPPHVIELGWRRGAPHVLRYAGVSMQVVDWQGPFRRDEGELGSWLAQEIVVQDFYDLKLLKNGGCRVGFVAGTDGWRLYGWYR